MSPARARAPALLLALAAALSACERSEDPVVLFADGDYEQAFPLFEARAAEGDPAARNFLGIHYYLGVGVARDFDKAATWFGEAARDGHADAQKNLGLLYLRGLGVKQSNLYAWGWLYHAHAGGNAAARLYLNTLVDSVTPNAGARARDLVAAELQDP